MPPSRPVDLRLMEKVELPDSGCWLWTGAINSVTGYGTIWVAGRMQYVHRVAYELAVGPIPDGLTIDHLCRIRNCVNLDHLEVVPLGKNILRGAGPPAVNATKTHCQRGHEFTPANTYLYRRLRDCRTCRAERQRRWREQRGAA